MKQRGRIGLLALAVAAVSVAGATAAFAGPSSNEKAGFKTARASMLSPVMTGVQVEPLLTVGDVLPSGFRFEAIPDGISVRTYAVDRVPGREAKR